MKRVSLLGAALLFAASAQAFAQQKDTRGKVTLPMPPARTPAVADAAQSRDAAAVKKLIAQGADVNIPEGDGMTALHWAAEHGDSAMTIDADPRSRGRESDHAHRLVHAAAVGEPHGLAGGREGASRGGRGSESSGRERRDRAAPRGGRRESRCGFGAVGKGRQPERARESSGARLRSSSPPRTIVRPRSRRCSPKAPIRRSARTS